MPAGRPSVPNALKTLRGNPSKRPMNKSTDDKFKKIETIGQYPSVFIGNQVAIDEWTRLGNQIAQMGLLAETDLAIFTSYCMTFSRWVQAEELINDEGIIVSSMAPNGIVTERKNPAVNVAIEYLATMQRLLVQLGFTPASRTKILLPEDKEVDVMAGMLADTNTGAYKPKKKRAKKKSKK